MLHILMYNSRNVDHQKVTLFFQTLFLQAKTTWNILAHKKASKLSRHKQFADYSSLQLIQFECSPLFNIYHPTLHPPPSRLVTLDTRTTKEHLETNSSPAPVTKNRHRASPVQDSPPLIPKSQHRKRQNRRFIKHEKYIQLKQQDMQRTNTVVNASSHPLTPAQTKLLIKNLSFCPTPHAINYIELSEDVYRFCRRLRLAEFFCDREDTETDNDADPPHATLPDFLPKPSPFAPDSGRDIALDTYIKAVTTDIMTLRQKDFSPNLTPDEKTALKDLKTNTNIIIKPADKGGAVVVMNTADYTTECTKQLSNTLYYKKLESDPTATYNNTIKRVLQEGMDQQELDIKTGHSLFQPHPTPGRFYILPKIHKEGHPGRPITLVFRTKRESEIGANTSYCGNTL
ncbi:hypothetical protein ElyMa_002018900 [Elysia marginata]|uniref:Uncharacterized protein n=1 Tax=Elysia marginata TaxID=1093978 RepID=A0AAV4F4Q8_9GAST|nr:hypothetical protein ElyMa_002018900 [Elysia marginata]